MIKNNERRGTLISKNIGVFKSIGEYFKIYKEINPDAFSIGKTSLELYHSKGFKPDLTPFADAKVDYSDNIATKPDYKLFSVVLDAFPFSFLTSSGTLYDSVSEVLEELLDSTTGLESTVDASPLAIQKEVVNKEIITTTTIKEIFLWEDYGLI